MCDMQVLHQVQDCAWLSEKMNYPLISYVKQSALGRVALC